MENIVLRKAQSGDEKILAYIQTQSWKSAFCGILSAEELERSTNPEKVMGMYQRILDAGNINITIEEVAGKPHCIAAWGKNRCGLDDAVAELICIHSLPDKWRRGCGSQMMQYILAEMKAAGYSEVILWVFEKNMNARRFYEKHGFGITERREESHGAAEVMYRKIL